MRNFTAEDALHRTFNQPLEVSERAGDGTLAPAVAVLAGAVIRDETDLHSALTIAFAAGAHFAGGAAGHPPATDGAAGF